MRNNDILPVSFENCHQDSVGPVDLLSVKFVHINMPRLFIRVYFSGWTANNGLSPSI